MIKEVNVKASKLEDVNSSFIWGVNLVNSSREIYRIKNISNNKAVWVEVINATSNFIENYNKRSNTRNIDKSEVCLVASEWYRVKLGLNKNINQQIKVKKTFLPNFLKTFLASKDHPDSNVRLATYLAIISVILGFIGSYPVFKELYCISNNLIADLSKLWACAMKA